MTAKATTVTKIGPLRATTINVKKSTKLPTNQNLIKPRVMILISIAPEAEYRDSRYIFSVKLQSGTKWKLISQCAEEVRRLLEVEVLTPYVAHHSIKLIVS